LHCIPSCDCARNLDALITLRYRNVWRTQQGFRHQTAIFTLIRWQLGTAVGLYSKRFM
jgi:hypothetical protein